MAEIALRIWVKPVPKPNFRHISQKVILRLWWKSLLKVAVKYLSGETCPIKWTLKKTIENRWVDYVRNVSKEQDLKSSVSVQLFLCHMIDLSVGSDLTVNLNRSEKSCYKNRPIFILKHHNRKLTHCKIFLFSLNRFSAVLKLLTKPANGESSHDFLLLANEMSLNNVFHIYSRDPVFILTEVHLATYTSNFWG